MEAGGFYYFMPGVMKGEVINRGIVDQTVLEAFDLAGAFRDERSVNTHCIVQELSTGPDGGPGVLIYHRPTSEEVVKFGIYRPANQEWSRFRKYWIGYDQERPPNSASLLRGNLYPGVQMQDDTGQVWLLPVIRAEQKENSSLPTGISWDEDGNIVESPMAKFMDLWQLSGEIYNDISLASKDKKYDEAWYLSAAVKIMQLNHRINEAGLKVLAKEGSILSTENVAHICMVAIEFQFSSFVKKNLETPGVLNASPGSSENTHPTDRPEGL